MGLSGGQLFASQSFLRRGSYSLVVPCFSLIAFAHLIAIGEDTNLQLKGHDSAVVKVNNSSRGRAPSA